MFFKCSTTRSSKKKKLRHIALDEVEVVVSPKNSIRGSTQALIQSMPQVVIDEVLSYLTYHRSPESARSDIASLARTSQRMHHLVQNSRLGQLIKETQPTRLQEMLSVPIYEHYFTFLINQICQSIIFSIAIIVLYAHDDTRPFISYATYLASHLLAGSIFSGFVKFYTETYGFNNEANRPGRCGCLCLRGSASFIGGATLGLTMGLIQHPDDSPQIFVNTMLGGSAGLYGVLSHFLTEQAINKSLKYCGNFFQKSQSRVKEHRERLEVIDEKRPDWHP